MSTPGVSTPAEHSAEAEVNRDSKAESLETATVAGEGDASVAHRALKEEPGAKWKGQETHEIPYK